MMESKLSVMERVKRDEGAGGGGGEIGHLNDYGFMIQYLFQSNAISDYHLSLEILTQVNIQGDEVVVPQGDVSANSASG